MTTRISFILMAIAAIAIAFAAWRLTRPISVELTLPPPPETYDEGFDRREEIVAEMLSDPRSWEEHLDIAVALLLDEQRLFLRHRYWVLTSVSHDDRQLKFTFAARQPGNLTTLPEWRGEGGESVGEMFTIGAYRWICARPETAAIWDVHETLFTRDGTSVMQIVITDRLGETVLRELPVELIPCADREAVSDG